MGPSAFGTAGRSIAGDGGSFSGNAVAKGERTQHANAANVARKVIAVGREAPPDGPANSRADARNDANAKDQARRNIRWFSIHGTYSNTNPPKTAELPLINKPPCTRHV
jgi:hypothetical protein